MGLFDWFKRKKKAEDSEEETIKEYLKNAPLSRDELDMTYYKERDEYVRNCCVQMSEASKEVDNMRMEYQLVTDYLTDMEEIEALPEEEKEGIQIVAKQILALKDERKNYQFKAKTRRMTDLQFRTMERIEDEMPEGLEKLKKNEEYQGVVKQDLNVLEGEKGYLAYKKQELFTEQMNAKGMTVIIIFSVVITLIMLLVLQFAFEMDTKIGYLATAGVAAIVITFIFVRYKSAEEAYLKVERDLNRIILLQNKVKIKYVNITNLIDYLYGKYNVNSAYELGYLWEKYLEEQEEREKFSRSSGDLEYFSRQLINLLRRFHIKDPNIWVNQVVALLDSKEMVEVRHDLIIRRQRLRKRMEYNTENMNVAKTEISSLVKEYPEYAKDIIAIVEEYE